MKLFPYGHATHPQWQMAAGLVLAQLRAYLALPGYAKSPTLALLYITDHYAPHAQDILDHLSAELPDVTDWSGTVGVGIASNNVEYFDEPALTVMLCELPHDQYRVFSGVSPPPPASSGRFKAHTALVHADAATPDVAELIDEMAQAHRQRLCVRRPGVQPLQHRAVRAQRARQRQRRRARPAACSAAG